VQAILNEIDGYDHSRTTKVGVPAIFGMNFQTVSTADKLLQSEARIGGPVLPGGYLAGTTVPGPLLRSALDYVDQQLQLMDGEIQAQAIADQTAIIVTAKHGQSPQDPSQLTRIKDGPIVDAINAAWTAAHPGAANLIVAGTDDDLWQSYLSDRSPQATDFVKRYLWTHTATGVTYRGGSRTLAHSGLARIYAGRAAARFLGVPAWDPRHLDVFGRVQVGVVYTGGTKIGEHGGDNQATVTSRSWSTHLGSSQGRPTSGCRQRRSPPRSCGCSGSTRTPCGPSRSSARGCFPASGANLDCRSGNSIEPQRAGKV
jgi:hypothetical protein